MSLCPWSMVHWKSDKKIHLESDILFLKPDSSIFRQSSYPEFGSWKSQASSSCTVQSLTCSIIEKQHTGLDDCLNVLLACFRKRMSVSNVKSVTLCRPAAPVVLSDTRWTRFQTALTTLFKYAILQQRRSSSRERETKDSGFYDRNRPRIQPRT